MAEKKDLNLLVSSIDKKGFCVVDSYLSADVVREFNSILDHEVSRSEQEHPYRNFDKCHIHDLFVRYPRFLEIVDDTFLDNLLANFIGEHWVLYAATSSSVPPGKKNFASRVHVDSPRFVPGYAFNMGVIWTLSDYTIENGCLEVMPYSHLEANEPALEVFERKKIKVICEKGSLIIFNARVFHRTTPNNSKHWRHALTMNACRSFMKQRMDWVQFFGTDYVAGLNNRLKRVIGYDTRVPSNMDEYSQPEKFRFYKSNQG